ncbi:CMGC protein kinase [Nannizzia gypsea CBS 118893]|uniref:CMGC protein kinase n=1 Tax=Arthroderma gypseum (strain ATCC MYA-4604 / CBS 118893) TaxID=535722 RepID=E5QZU6_ARTGP|nr:CMGC protein kinase [Nannizzia gypsea CBS 118893]EFQ97409.1 CMGC protein kinase [Nannizzia gypsea CBS 118893]
MTRPIYELLTKGKKVLINGRHVSYQVITSLKKNVFQAVTVGNNKPVMIKTESSVPGVYDMERNCYEFLCIKSSPYIRAIYEVIDNDIDRCMVFEWMDTDLWTLRPRAQELCRPFLKATAKPILKVIKAFSDMDGQDAVVNTGINPNNILVSNVDSPQPLVKLSDLGADIRGLIKLLTSTSNSFQGVRWVAASGFGHSGARDIEKGFTRTAMRCLVHWRYPHFSAARALFGPGDQDSHAKALSKGVNQAAWSIAKITQLVGPLQGMRIPADVFVQRRIIEIGSLREELIKVNVPTDYIDFIQYLLTVDHRERPTAEEALQHPWLQG